MRSSVGAPPPDTPTSAFAQPICMDKNRSARNLTTNLLANVLIHLEQSEVEKKTSRIATCGVKDLKSECTFAQLLYYIASLKF